MEATYKCRVCGEEVTVTTNPGPDDSDIVQPPAEGCPSCGNPIGPRDRIG